MFRPYITMRCPNRCSSKPVIDVLPWIAIVIIGMSMITAGICFFYPISLFYTSFNVFDAMPVFCGVLSMGR